MLDSSRDREEQNIGLPSFIHSWLNVTIVKKDYAEIGEDPICGNMVEVMSIQKRFYRGTNCGNTYFLKSNKSVRVRCRNVLDTFKKYSTLNFTVNKRDSKQASLCTNGGDSLIRMLQFVPFVSVYKSFPARCRERRRILISVADIYLPNLTIFLSEDIE
ncbi:hypothetical protein TNCV_216991 [Trichonephila clavipes]|nr:hypothetical protein TNCV_216991 [Trichonephila clavipes]